MYKLIVTTRGNSYCVFGETLDKKDYPTIELGSTVFIPELNKMFIVTNDESFVDVTGEENIETPEDTTPPEDAVVTPPVEDDEEEETTTEGEEKVVPDEEGTESTEDPEITE